MGCRCTSNYDCGTNEHCVGSVCKGVCCNHHCSWWQKCVNYGTHSYKCMTWFGMCKMRGINDFLWVRCATGRAHSWYRAGGEDCFCYNSRHAYWDPHPDGWGIWGSGTRMWHYYRDLDSHERIEPPSGSKKGLLSTEEAHCSLELNMVNSGM